MDFGSQEIPPQQNPFYYYTYQYPMPPFQYQAPPPPPVDNGCSLFVFHLPQSVDDQKLYNLFRNFGQLKSARVIIDTNTEKSKGYGFLNFGSTRNALQAIATMNGYKIDNKHLKVEFKKEDKYFEGYQYNY